MSPRAACRLATLGFTEVYDYVTGKVDWLARNQPVHGTGTDTPTIGQRLRQEVITARPDDSLAEVRDRVAGSAHRFALVTTAEGILLGRLRSTALADGDPARAVGTVMEAGPSTLRPHEPAATVKTRLEDKTLTYAIVTDPGRAPTGHGSSHRPVIGTGWPRSAPRRWSQSTLEVVIDWSGAGLTPIFASSMIACSPALDNGRGNGDSLALQGK